MTENSNCWHRWCHDAVFHIVNWIHVNEGPTYGSGHWWSLQTENLLQYLVVLRVLCEFFWIFLNLKGFLFLYYYYIIIYHWPFASIHVSRTRCSCPGSLRYGTTTHHNPTRYSVWDTAVQWDSVAQPQSAATYEMLCKCLPVALSPCMSTALEAKERIVRQ